jgi:hypothetical protein
MQSTTPLLNALKTRIENLQQMLKNFSPCCQENVQASSLLEKKKHRELIEEKVEEIGAGLKHSHRKSFRLHAQQT